MKGATEVIKVDFALGEGGVEMGTTVLNRPRLAILAQPDHDGLVGQLEGLGAILEGLNGKSGVTRHGILGGLGFGVALFDFGLSEFVPFFDGFFGATGGPGAGVGVAALSAIDFGQVVVPDANFPKLGDGTYIVGET